MQIITSTKNIFIEIASTNTDILALRKKAYSLKNKIYSKEFLDNIAEGDHLDKLGLSETLVAKCSTTLDIIGSVRLTSSMTAQGHLPESLKPFEKITSNYLFIDRFNVDPEYPNPKEVSKILMKGIWVRALEVGAEGLVALSVKALARKYFYFAAFEYINKEAILVPNDLHLPVYLVGTHMNSIISVLKSRNPEFLAYLLNGTSCFSTFVDDTRA